MHENCRLVDNTSSMRGLGDNNYKVYGLPKSWTNHQETYPLSAQIHHPYMRPSPDGRVKANTPNFLTIKCPCRAQHWAPTPISVHAHGFWVGMGAILFSWLGMGVIILGMGGHG